MVEHDFNANPTLTPGSSHSRGFTLSGEAILSGVDLLK